MKKQRVLALLLCLALLCTLIPGVFAANDNTSSKGMEISKTATANSDGTYTVTLEAYATGSKIISEVKKDIPTDIVLVLDQSGSMKNDIGSVSFSQYSGRTNTQYYNLRHNGGSSNLWYKVGEKYYSVSVKLESKVSYTEIDSKWNWPNYSFIADNYYDNRDNLYAKVNGEYKKVTVDYAYDRDLVYTYKLPDGTVIATSIGYDDAPTFSGIDDNVLYLASSDTSQNVYTYIYTDEDGKLQTIGTSTGATTRPSFEFYERATSSSGGGSRLNALKKAVTTFANTPSYVACQVTESFDGETKSNVNVKNTGDTEAYIRVKLVTYRVNTANQHIGGTAEIPDFTPGTNWVKYGEYYYYTKPVAPNEWPEDTLIGTDGITLEGSYEDADGGKQVIEVMAEAIQSGPAEAVVSSWGVDPSTLS